MFVTISDVKRRLDNLKGSYQIRHNINIVSESTITDVFTFEKFIDNWKNLNPDNFTAFKMLLESVVKFFNNSKSKSDCNKVVNILCNKVLPNVENLKRARQLIDRKYNSINIDNKLIDECNVLIACDRVANNQIKLEKLYDINGYLKQNCSSSDRESIIDSIYGLSSMIDSLNIELDIKYNLALENVLYSLNKNHISIDRKTIIETITEYFVMNHTENIETIKEILSETVYYKDEDKIDINLDIEEPEEGEETILEASINPVRDIINKLKKTPNLTGSAVKSAINKIYTKSADNIISETPNFLSWIRQLILYSSFSINIYLGCLVLFVDKFIQMSLQRKETDKFISKMRNERDKVEKKLKTIKSKEAETRLHEYLDALDNNIKKLEDYKENLYSERELANMNEQQQIDLRTFLGENVVSMDEFITNHSFMVDRNLKTATAEFSKITNSMYGYLKDDIKMIPNNGSFKDPNHIITSLDSDGRLLIPISYIYYKNFTGEIEDVINLIVDRIENKLEDYFSIIYDKDDEFFKIFLSYDFVLRYDKEQDSEDIHSDYLNEMNLILSLTEQVEQFNSYKDTLDYLYDAIDTLDDNDFDNITCIVTSKQDTLERDNLIKLYNNYKSHLYKSDTPGKYRLGSCLEENISKLKNMESLDENTNRYEVYNKLAKINEGLEAINETSLKNNIMIAREKLKKAALKLSDKEKTMSKQLDNALANFNDNIQTKLSNKNREAVIKGRILPSASTTLKIALASGVAALFNPALAVIGALGALGASAAGTKKEKQFILDEIDIQLKLVEKKIQLAENNNDMKALEQLLKIEQKLKREKQRILYRLKHYHPVVARD